MLAEQVGVLESHERDGSCKGRGWGMGSAIDTEIEGEEGSIRVFGKNKGIYSFYKSFLQSPPCC